MKKEKKVLSNYEIIQKFSTEEKAIKFFEYIRWKNGVYCPECDSKRIAKRDFPYYRCKDCRQIFTVRTNSIFHRSKIELKKWMYTIYLLQTARKGISSLQLSKEIGVTQKTAWFMLHRIREACKATGLTFSGKTTVDETHFGGDPKYKRNDKKTGLQGVSSKTMVQGIKSNNQVKFHILKGQDKKTMQANILKDVEFGSTIQTDEARGYIGLNKHYNHVTVSHSKGQYVDHKTGATTNV
ncbi:MAG: IS1595 family transposase [Bdellovibrionales bacterium]|nr:IS1595 family transposase [Bdellovibrionales bacterium]